MPLKPGVQAAFPPYACVGAIWKPASGIKWSHRNCSSPRLLDLVARGGLEPPTPAFSGPRSTN